MTRLSKPGPVLATAASLAALASTGLASEPSPARQGELLYLLRHDCGSCHGLRMTGGLGPSLLAADLRGKSQESLVEAVLHGRPGTPMPGWEGLLDEADAEWLVRALQRVERW